MEEVSVKLPLSESEGYKVHVGAGTLQRIGSLVDAKAYSRIVVVTDESVERLLLKELLESLPGAVPVILPSGEDNKTIDSVQKVWQALYDAGCDRKSLVVNLGGGVIGDIGGFAASTYMRGIDFLNVPTTLLSQVDSSIGGKTGVNFAGIKNLVGSFRQPIGVIIDPRTLETLPQRELASGFAEVIKHGLIWDKDYFEQATAKRPADFGPDELTDIIAGSCRIKLAIIQDDIKEGGQRKLVNFGHTVGHAIEALSHQTDKPLLHGEAVSAGMVAEAGMSAKLGRLQAADMERIKHVLTDAGLPVTVSGLRPAAVRDKMRSDKKNTGGKLNFTLLEAIGKASYNQEVPEAMVEEALQAVLR
jgi:3-dehydroquinate synthase